MTSSSGWATMSAIGPPGGRPSTRPRNAEGRSVPEEWAVLMVAEERGTATGECKSCVSPVKWTATSRCVTASLEGIAGRLIEIERLSGDAGPAELLFDTRACLQGHRRAASGIVEQHVHRRGEVP